MLIFAKSVTSERKILTIALVMIRARNVYEKQWLKGTLQGI